MKDKMKKPAIKKPLQPLLLNDWLTGALYGSRKNKSHYGYCIHGDESIESIAKKLAGQRIKKDESYCYEKELDWKKLAQFNYGTSDPSEINWYLSNFNGCRNTDSSGNNFILSSNDTNPFLWIPVSNTAFAGKTGTSLKIVVDTSDITSVFFEDENSKKIDVIEKNAYVFLIIETRNAIGNKIDIDLSDMKTEFKHNGNLLDNSILHDLEITSDKMKLKLEIPNGGK